MYVSNEFKNKTAIEENPIDKTTHWATPLAPDFALYPK